MKRMFTVTAALAMVMFATSMMVPGDGIKQLKIGAEAPKTEYKLKNIDGRQTTLKELKGKNGLLVVFSCNTCPWVIKWENRYNDLAKQAGKNGVNFVAVNSNEARRGGDDSFDKMKAHAKDKSYDFPYVVDKDHVLADAFGATRTPHVYLFDKDMKLVYVGAIDDNAEDKAAVKKPYLKNAIENLSKGKEIDPNSTKSAGCTIKRNT